MYLIVYVIANHGNPYYSSLILLGTSPCQTIGFPTLLPISMYIPTAGGHAEGYPKNHDTLITNIF